MSASGFSEEELVETFQEILEDHGIISKAEVKEMIAKAAEEDDLQDVDQHKAREREADAAAEAAEETWSLTVERLRETLPDNVWEIVSRYMADAGEDLPEADMVGMGDDVEKAVGDAFTTSRSTLTKVRSELAANQETSTSYEGTKKSRGPISKTLLSDFYGTMESKEAVRKSKKGKDAPAGLTAVEESEDL